MTTLVDVLAINRDPDSMARRSTWIAVALAIAVLAIVIAVIASAWSARARHRADGARLHQQPARLRRAGRQRALMGQR